MKSFEKSYELNPEPGHVFVVQDSCGNFLRCFYQGREKVTSFHREALQFDNLQLAATFGCFWRGIAHESILPLFIVQIEKPRQPVTLLGYGKSRRAEQPKPFWRLV
jgi:hypothetical protein